MKRVILIGVIAALSIFMTLFQIQLIKKETLQSFKEVVILSRDIKVGEVIEDNDVEIGQINTAWFSDDYYTAKSNVIGKTAVVNLSRSTILSKTLVRITVNENQLTDPEHAMTTLKIVPEEALCWSLEKGDEVELFCVSQDLDTVQDLGKIMIKAIYDDRLGDESIPVYVLIEATPEAIAEIIRQRESGRFELVRMNP